MRLGVVDEETSGKRELSCRVKPGSDSRSGFRSYLTARHAVAPAVLCTMTQIKNESNHQLLASTTLPILNPSLPVFLPLLALLL